MDPVDVIGCTSTTTDAIYATGVISQQVGVRDDNQECGMCGTAFDQTQKGEM